MRLERKLTLGVAFAFAVLLLTAFVPFYTARTAQDLQQEAYSSTQRVELLAQTLLLLRDAESGQRGFVITGREDFLDTYHSSVALLGRIRPELERELGGVAEAHEHLAQLGSLMDSKLQELADTIALRRSAGFQAVQPIVTAAHGKQYMDKMVVLIDQLTELEATRREALRAELARRTDFNAYAGLGITMLDLAILSSLMYVLLRVMSQRQRANKALRDTETNLSASVGELQRRNAEILLVGEMTRALDTPTSTREIFEIIALYGAKLFPGTSAILYAINNSRDLLEPEGRWGMPHKNEHTISPQDCWAMRRGQPNRDYGGSGLACPHSKSNVENEGSGAFCVPLIAHGEVLGLLSITPHASGEPTIGLDAAQETLVIVVAEQVSLSLSNMILREALRHQSIIDSLTGLFNRRYLEETLRREIAHSARKKLAFSLIVMDVDHFKKVNDRFGHDAGDTVLRAMAQQLKAAVREGDVACRYGGEEFVLLLPDCDKHAAAARAEAILGGFRALEVSRGSQIIGSVTASFGVAAYPTDGADSEVLFKAADRAMYVAKRSGRNRVVLAGNAEVEPSLT